MASLLNTKVQEIKPCPHHILTQPDDTTFAKLFKLLLSHHIQSLPITDQKGILKDVVDVSSLVLQICESWPDTQSVISMKGTGTESAWETTSWPVMKETRVADVLKLLAKYSIRRLPIIDEVGKVEGVLAQLDLASWIALQEDLPFFSKPLKEFSIGTGRTWSYGDSVIALQLDTPAIEGFKSLSEKRISVLSVVDGQGKLCYNLSVDDIRLIGLDFEHIDRLKLPLRDYLTSDPGQPAIKPLVVSLDTSYKEALNLFYNHQVHHLWVVNDSQAPVDCLGLRDLLQIFLQCMEKAQEGRE